MQHKPLPHAVAERRARRERNDQAAGERGAGETTETGGNTARDVLDAFNAAGVIDDPGRASDEPSSPADEAEAPAP